MKIRHLLPLCLVALVYSTAFGEDTLWQTNFEAAKSQAKAEQKLLLVDFTGSDWCGPCNQLKKEVFDTDEFKAEAPKQFVLVELDFPHEKELPADLKEQNKELQKEYKVTAYPTICMLDADGRIITKLVGYAPTDVKKYMARLAKLMKLWDDVLALKAKLADTNDLERAKMLDQLVELYDKLSNPSDELAVWSKEIIALDSDNKAGLKSKYECRDLMAAAEKLGKANQYPEAVAVLDKVLAYSDLSGKTKQAALFQKGTYQLSLKDFAAALASMKDAVKTAPKGPKAAMAKSKVKSIEATVKAIDEFAKLQGGLDKAEGADRAKLLDQLIQKNKELGASGAGKLKAAEVTAWSAEIITLDPDNTLGLKNKYEFNRMLTDAYKLRMQKNYDEGHAMLDKALAISGITADQTQDALMAKGTSYFLEKDFEKSLDAFKLALEAAPDSSRAANVKLMIKAVESRAKKAAPKKAEETVN